MEEKVKKKKVRTAECRTSNCGKQTQQKDDQNIPCTHNNTGFHGSEPVPQSCGALYVLTTILLDHTYVSVTLCELAASSNLAGSWNFTY